MFASRIKTSLLSRRYGKKDHYVATQERERNILFTWRMKKRLTDHNDDDDDVGASGNGPENLSKLLYCFARAAFVNQSQPSVGSLVHSVVAVCVVMAVMILINRTRPINHGWFDTLGRISIQGVDFLSRPFDAS